MSMAQQSSAVNEFGERAQSSLWELSEVLFGLQREGEEELGRQVYEANMLVVCACLACLF